MQTRFIDNEFKYDGEQLRSLFAYLKFGILGDSIVSWVGPCDVSLDHMVDGEDLNANAAICGDKMLHFVIECFDSDLFYGVAIQRIMAAITIDLIKQNSTHKDLTEKLLRIGDDVFCEEDKLSISVATRSPTSTLIHFAINVVNDGTPVNTCSLTDFNLEAKDFSTMLMVALNNELDSIKQATQKVKWVK